MIQARKVTDITGRAWNDDPQVRDTVQKGDFEITKDEATGQRWFWFKCPGACGQVSAIALRPVVKPTPGQHSWEFDGNEEAPTLSPSINHVGCWHGFLRAGVFTSC
jgi:hypothetical protein